MVELLDLDDGALSVVLGFLDVKSLCAAARTCRRMRDCARSEVVWHDVVERQFQTHAADAFARERSWRRMAMRRYRHGALWDTAREITQIFETYVPVPSLGQAYRSETAEDSRRAMWESVRAAFQQLKRVLALLPEFDAQLLRILRSLGSQPKKKQQQPMSFDLALDVAELGEFAFYFDIARMKNPALLNDLSMLHRYAHTFGDERGDISGDVLRNLVFFLARPAPVIHHMRQLLAKEEPQATLFAAAAPLARLANAFVDGVVGEGGGGLLMPRLLLSGAAFSVLVYDAILSERTDAFTSSRCPIAMPRLLEILTTHPDAQEPSLLGFLRYHSLHVAAVLCK